MKKRCRFSHLVHISLCVALMGTAALAAETPGGAAGAPTGGSDTAGENQQPAVSAPPTDPVESLPRETEAAGRPPSVPIRVAGREIVGLRASLGAFTPEERAAAAKRRIREVVLAPRYAPEQIRVLERNGRLNIAYGDRVLFAVVDRDLPEEDLQSPREAADRVARELAQAIGLDRASRSPQRLAWAAGLTLLVLVAVVGLERFLIRFFRRARQRIALWRGTRLRGIRVRGLDLVSADTMVSGAQTTLSVLRAAVFLLVAYVAVSVIMFLFPWTQPYGRASADFVLGAVVRVARGIFGYIPNLFMIALTVVVVRYINRFVGFIFDAIARGVLVLPGFYPELAAPTKQISRWLIWTLGLVVIFPYLPGSGTPAFQGVGVFVGLMVSLGSAGAIGNLVSGIVLTYTRSFSIGDRVRIADTTGDVVDHGLLSTKIVTIKNEEITIPNGAILGNHIVNYTELAEGKGLILHTAVTIGYDVPWRTVHPLLIDAARATGGILADPEPFVLQTGLDDFYVHYEINAYTREPRRMATIYGELHQNIQDRFFAAGVEIMSPHYSSLRDGNTAAIPPEQRSARHVPGAFRVRKVGGETTAGGD